MQYFRQMQGVAQPSTNLAALTRLTDFGSTSAQLWIDLMPGGAAVPAGATVIVGWVTTEWHTYSSRTDNQGNTYTEDYTAVGAQVGERCHFLRCSNVTNGPTRFLVTADQGTSLRLFVWVESGLSNTLPLDQTDAESTAGGNNSSSTVHTNFPSETMFTIVKPSGAREPTAVAPSELLVLGFPVTATAYWGLRRTCAAPDDYTNAATFSGAAANTDSFTVTYKATGT